MASGTDVEVDSAKSSDGSEWHGIFRKGTENKVVVYFFGGGVSITPKTSEGGKEFYATGDFHSGMGTYEGRKCNRLC